MGRRRPKKVSSSDKLTSFVNDFDAVALKASQLTIAFDKHKRLRCRDSKEFSAERHKHTCCARFELSHK
jgi:hypothetical protein